MSRSVSLADAYDAFPQLEAEFCKMLDRSLAPRGPDALLDLVAELGLQPAARALDLGCGEGEDTAALARRFGLAVSALDPVFRRAQIAHESAAELAVTDRGEAWVALGTAEHIPIASAAVDFVWCREVLMYADLHQAPREMFRVLRPGGAAVVYQVCTGARMDDTEAAQFWSDIGANSVRPDELANAMSRAGFVVTRAVEFASEWGEKAEEERGAGTRRLLHAARLLRKPDIYIEAFGTTAYRIMLSDCLWHVYRMIGKLSGVAIVLRKPMLSARTNKSA